MVLSDREIAHRVATARMIDPFVDHQVTQGVISYGLSSYGYDFRIAGRFKIPSSHWHGTYDPKAFDANAFQDVTADGPLVVPPGSFVLGQSLEYFRIPRDVLTICCGKSTYARCGVSLNVTPFEPDWEGHATIAVANTGSRPAVVYPHEGIAQLLFLLGSTPCQVSYKDRKGRYDSQQGIVPPIVRT